MPKNPFPGIPGDQGWPVIGDLLAFYRDIDQLIEKKYRAYGPVFQWKALTPSICLLGAEANQYVLVSHQKQFSAQLAWQNYIGVLFRGGLLNRDGADHRKHRLLLQPAFRKEALANYLKIAEPIIDQHVESWPLEPEDVYALCKELTLEIAIRVFFGISYAAELEQFNHHISNVLQGSIAFFKLPLLGHSYQKALQSRKELCRMLLPIIQYRRHNESQDMLGLLCQAKDETGAILSDEEIMDQMIFILMAAHDTTASTLTSLFYELGIHMDWQERLIDESRSQELRDLSITEQTDQLSSIKWTIKETLRRHAPLRIIPRVSLSAFQFAGFEIMEGAGISLIPAFSHHMEEYWNSPQRFDPERFSRNEPLHPYAFIPFGGGVHMCLGQFFAENFASIIIHKVLKERRWHLAHAPIRFQKVPIQVPYRKLAVRFEKSNKLSHLASAS